MAIARRVFFITFQCSANIVLYCAIFCLALPLTSGCAVVKATQQPEKKDLSILTQGAPRTHVIAELGAPTWSDQRGDETVDVFAFKQGYTKPVKAGRALVHGAADVATFGLWEVVGIPVETLADGTDVRVEVHYDTRQTVRTIEVIKGQAAFEQPKLAQWWQRKRAGKPPASAPRQQPVEMPETDNMPDALDSEPAEIIAGDLPEVR